MNSINLNNTEIETNYSDEFIILNKDELTINKYYYPFKKKKIIKIGNINNIKLIEMDRMSGKYTFYGFCWKFYWYHLDKKRPQKKFAIIINEKNNSITIGITPNDTQKCFQVLNYLYNNNIHTNNELMTLNEKQKDINNIAKKID